MVFEISEISQVIRDMYEKDISKHCKRLNKAIKYVHNCKLSIRIPKLDLNLLMITAYKDDAFANNADLSS